MVTINQNTVTEEEIQKEEARLDELYKKADRNDEEAKEFDDLKQKRTSRYQKKIDKMTWENKSTKEELERERQERERLEKELEKSKKAKEQQQVSRPGTYETVDIEGKYWLTDNALRAKISAQEMTSEQAYDYQRQRDRAEDRATIRKELKQEEEQTSIDKVRKEDALGVLKEYPHFNPKDPNHNPQDPLFQLSMQLYNEGLAFNPSGKGLSMAVKRAKQILGQTGKNVDTTEDLTLHSTGAPPAPSKKTKEVPITEGEKEVAVRMYRNRTNPKTGRLYTEQEAIARYKTAKNNRRVT